MATAREVSKQTWNGTANSDSINMGSLQRIADAVERSAAAVEKVAADYDAMRRDRDNYREWYKQGNADKDKLYKRLSALQGVITKQRKKLAGK